LPSFHRLAPSPLAEYSSLRRYPGRATCFYLPCGLTLSIELLQVGTAASPRIRSRTSAKSSPGDGHLRHLEDRPPGITYDLGSYLYQLELYARERPVGYLAGQGESPEEVAQVVGQDEEGQPHLVGGEPHARQSGPDEGTFALLYSVFTLVPLVVESHHLLRYTAQVGDDEAHSR